MYDTDDQVSGSRPERAPRHVDPERFAGLGPEWFWSDELERPDLDRTKAEEISDQVLATYQKTGWTIKALARSFKCHARTIQRALQIAVDRAGLPYPSWPTSGEWAEAHSEEVWASRQQSGNNIRALGREFGHGTVTIKAALLIAAGVRGVEWDVLIPDESWAAEHSEAVWAGRQQSGMSVEDQVKAFSRSKVTIKAALVIAAGIRGEDWSGADWREADPRGLGAGAWAEEHSEEVWAERQEGGKSIEELARIFKRRESWVSAALKLAAGVPGVHRMMPPRRGSGLNAWAKEHSEEVWAKRQETGESVKGLARIFKRRESWVSAALKLAADVRGVDWRVPPRRGPGLCAWAEEHSEEVWAKRQETLFGPEALAKEFGQTRATIKAALLIAGKSRGVDWRRRIPDDEWAAAHAEEVWDLGHDYRTSVHALSKRLRVSKRRIEMALKIAADRHGVDWRLRIPREEWIDAYVEEVWARRQDFRLKVIDLAKEFGQSVETIIATLEIAADRHGVVEWRLPRRSGSGLDKWAATNAEEVWARRQASGLTVRHLAREFKHKDKWIEAALQIAAESRGVDWRAWVSAGEWAAAHSEHVWAKRQETGKTIGSLARSFGQNPETIALALRLEEAKK